MTDDLGPDVRDPAYQFSRQMNAQGSNPLVANVAGVLLLLTVLAALAWPAGIATHGIWLLFLNGWSVLQ